MGRVTTVGVPVRELVELRAAKKAHDHYLQALETLRAGAFTVIRRHGADTEYARGYWAALSDISESIIERASQPVKDDLPW